MDQEVVDPTEEEHIQDAGKIDEPRSEGPNVRSRVRLKPDRDQRLKRPAESLGRQLNAEPTDHPRILEPPYPQQARRRRHADLARECIIGNPRVPRQRVQDMPIHVVELHPLLRTASNVIQATSPRSTHTRIIPPKLDLG